VSEKVVPPIHAPDHVPGGPDPLPFGDALFEIKVFEDELAVEAGPGKFKFAIPEDLDGAVLAKAEAWITTSTAGGDVVVSLFNNSTGNDLLASPLTIDAGTLNSKDSGSPAVVDSAHSTVSWGDEIWINVDNAGGMGLGVAVYFISLGVSAILVEAGKGDPGGVTDFEGDWSGSTVTYPAGTVVIHDGVAYLSTADHVSDPSTEPGVGADWETVWAPLLAVPVTASLTVNVFSSAGPVPENTLLTVTPVPYDATITEAWILADQATDAVVDIWKTDFGGYPPNSGDSICGGNPPTLAASIKNQDGALPGWITSLAEDDILAFWIQEVSVARRLTVHLKLERS